MKFRNLHLILAIALIALFASQVMADEVTPKEATTSAINPDKISADDVLTFFGGTNLRLYSIYYESGNSPWSVSMKMCASLGVTADLGSVFMGLTLQTGNVNHSNPTYGSATSNFVEFNFMNDMSVFFKEAYAIWRAHELVYVSLGRNPWTIDKNKKMYVYRTDLSFDSGLRLDTLGLFPVMFDKDGTVVTMSATVSYLGKYLDSTSGLPYTPGYRHFMLLGLQPKIHMAPQMMNILLGGGLWMITHPNDLYASGGASKQWGENVFGNDKNANLLMLELFGKLTIEQTNVFMHVMFNLGAEEQGVGAMVGFTHGAVKKTGDMRFGISLYYLESYAWLETFVSGTLGSGYKGVQLCYDWVFHQNMTFYAQCTFKNAIASGTNTTTGQIYLKTGIKVNFSLKPKK